MSSSVRRSLCRLARAPDGPFWIILCCAVPCFFLPHHCASHFLVLQPGSIRPGHVLVVCPSQGRCFRHLFRLFWTPLHDDNRFFPSSPCLASASSSPSPRRVAAPSVPFLSAARYLRRSSPSGLAGLSVRSVLVCSLASTLLIKAPKPPDIKHKTHLPFISSSSRRRIPKQPTQITTRTQRHPTPFIEHTVIGTGRRFVANAGLGIAVATPAAVSQALCTESGAAASSDTTSRRPKGGIPSPGTQTPSAHAPGTCGSLPLDSVPTATTGAGYTA